LQSLWKQRLRRTWRSRKGTREQQPQKGQLFGHCESVLSFTATEFVIQRVAQAKAGFADVNQTGVMPENPG